MATLAAATAVARTGTTVSGAFAAAAAGGDKFANNGKQMLAIANAHATLPRTVTLVSQQTVDGLAVADAAVVVPAESTLLIGPLKPSVFNDADGYVNLTYSDAADSLTVKVLSLTPDPN